jgi:hypothetical protein
MKKVFVTLYLVQGMMEMCSAVTWCGDEDVITGVFDHMIGNDVLMLVFCICSYGFCCEGGYRLRKTWPQERLSSSAQNMESHLVSGKLLSLPAS